MSEKPSVEAYKEFIKNEDFHAYKCVECGAIIAPPSGSCYACGSNKMEWATVKGTGKLVSFTVIHIAPDEFQSEAPYYVGIIELDEGTRVTGRLKGFDVEDPGSVKLGIPVVIDYEHGESGNTYLAFRPAQYVNENEQSRETFLTVQYSFCLTSIISMDFDYNGGKTSSGLHTHFSEEDNLRVS